MQRFEALLRNWAAINAFGATPPVDVVPILNWVPEKFFGNWKSRARVVHDEMHDLYNGLRERVLSRRQRTGSTNSIMDRLLDQNEKNGLSTHQISNLAGVTIKGGSDTSASVLASFVLAMVLHPEIQKKAQAEIDRVVPADRIPDISDFGRLPYLMSIIKETQRWRPITGIGVPHQLSDGRCDLKSPAGLDTDKHQIFGMTTSYCLRTRCCFSTCGDCTRTRSGTRTRRRSTQIVSRTGRRSLRNTRTVPIQRSGIITHTVGSPFDSGSRAYMFIADTRAQATVEDSVLVYILRSVI